MGEYVRNGSIVFSLLKSRFQSRHHGIFSLKHFTLLVSMNQPKPTDPWADQSAPLDEGSCSNCSLIGFRAPPPRRGPLFVFLSSPPLLMGDPPSVPEFHFAEPTLKIPSDAVSFGGHVRFIYMKGDTWQRRMDSDDEPLCR